MGGILIPSEKIFPGNVSKFLLEVPKFKENIPICIITVTKERDLLRTLLQVMKQYLRHSFQNE